MIARIPAHFLGLFEQQESEKWDELQGPYYYLSMSDDEKRADIAQYASYHSDTWLDFLAEETGKSYEPWDDYPRSDDVEEAVFEKFTSQVDIDAVANEILQNDPAEAPAWLTMWAVSPPQEYSLVHYTNDPYPILRDGFLGFSDVQRLALTSYFSDSCYDKNQKEGFAFAFDVNSRHNGAKYGDTPIYFEARAVQCYHSGDEEYQWVFWTAEARNIRGGDEDEEEE